MTPADNLPDEQLGGSPHPMTDTRISSLQAQDEPFALASPRQSHLDGWRPIAEAPTDDTRIIVRTKLGRVFVAYMGERVEGEEGRECWAWAAAEEGLHPPCWTDGLCWASNEDGEPSDPPAAWMPLPPIAPPSTPTAPTGQDGCEGPKAGANHIAGAGNKAPTP